MRRVYFVAHAPVRTTAAVDTRSSRSNNGRRRPAHQSSSEVVVSKCYAPDQIPGTAVEYFGTDHQVHGVHPSTRLNAVRRSAWSALLTVDGALVAGKPIYSRVQHVHMAVIYQTWNGGYVRVHAYSYTRTPGSTDI